MGIMFLKDATHPCILIFPMDMKHFGYFIHLHSLHWPAHLHTPVLYQFKRNRFFVPPWNAFLLPPATSFRKIREGKLKKMFFTFALPNHFSFEYEFFISCISKYLWIAVYEKCCEGDTRRTEITFTIIILF